MRFKNIRLHGFGQIQPPRVVTSEEIEQRLAPVYERLKLPPGRLELMSGIKERRLWEPGTRPSEAAARAGKAALKNTGIDRSKIDCLIFCSVSRDMLEPATASFVHHLLGLPETCLTFDISNACLGFMDGMLMMANLIEQGQIKQGLLVAGETAENLLETTINSLLTDKSLTRKTIKNSFASLTIGSGAVALVMGAADENNNGHRLIGGAYRIDSSRNYLCQGGSTNDGTLMTTDSGALLEQGVKTAHATWHDFLHALNWPADSIDQYFCHQVGQAHAKLLMETLGLTPEKNLETVSYTGNIGSVSAPLTMVTAIEQGLFKPGDRGALLGIGSGIVCMMLGVEW